MVTIRANEADGAAEAGTGDRGGEQSDMDLYLFAETESDSETEGGNGADANEANPASNAPQESGGAADPFFR